MDVAEPKDPAGVATAGADQSASNGNSNLPFDPLGDDGRSSSLSEIDDVSEQEVSDDESLQLGKPPTELDSEAETERIEESPSHARTRRDIIVSASRFESSPSKLAQSTTYDDLEDDDEGDVEETPSKSRALSNKNGLAHSGDEPSVPEDHGRLPSPPDLAGKKRKRVQSGDDSTAGTTDEEPLRKRRGSLRSDAGEDTPKVAPQSHEATEDPSKLDAPSPQATPTEDLLEEDVAVPASRTRKGKKGKRKGKKTKDGDDETENGTAEAAEEQADEDEGGDAADGEDAEAAGKSEEELARKISAIESLAELEKQFAILRDKIYHERIAKLDQELEQLNSPEPTHPELLRQLECVRQHRDAKIKYERTLFQYRMQALLNKSLAERAQIHSTFFQRIRDARERYSSAVSKQFYAIQHDRFRSEEISAPHYIPFPNRRSQQVAQQMAYNQEVSVMAGVAKYVGFPAAPELAPARPSVIEEDLAKMGISADPRPTGVSRGGLSPWSGMPRSSATAEGGLGEHRSWATNSAYAQPSGAPRSNYGFNSTSYTNPTAQKRVVDTNGSVPR